MKARYAWLGVFAVAAAPFVLAEEISPAVRGIAGEVADTAERSVSAHARVNPRFAAERLLRHVNYARVALGMGKQTLALQHIDKAIELNLILANLSPGRRSYSHIPAGRLLYGYDTSLGEHFFPFGSEPVEWNTLEDGPFWSFEPGIAVKATQLVYLSMRIDPQISGERLVRAREAIAIGQPQEAEDFLAGLVEEVAEVEETAALPLERARDNLALARYFLRAGQDDNARFALRHAEEALEEAQEAPEMSKRRERIHAMRREVAEMNETLRRRGETMREEIETRLHRWWHDLKNWASQRE